MKPTPIVAALLLMMCSRLVAQQNEKADEETPSQSGTSQVETTYASPLHDLEWMVGTWVDQGENATITTVCSWSHKGKFLSRSFKVATTDEVTLEGTQTIGWDPLEGRIRSWTFDSEGGRGEGRWYRDGDRWLVKTAFVLATGERASAINVITRIDDDTIGWQSTNREIAGELQPNIPEVKVVRKRNETATREIE